MNNESGKMVTLQELPELRKKTEAVARLLHEQLTRHFEVLRPVLSPERVLGKYAGGKGDSLSADRAFNELQQKCKALVGTPFSLLGEFEPAWANLVDNRPILYPWEYSHEASTARESRAVTMTSPLRWILTFTTDCNAAQVRSMLKELEPRRAESLRQFAVGALIMGVILSRTPGLARLLGDLRYDLKVEPVPEFGRLPLPLITSCLPCYRPADDLILAATAFSGVHAFIELVDIDAAKALQDPLRSKLEEILR
jgi:hypothetical protein